jgi:flagellar motor switch protein FliM
MQNPELDQSAIDALFLKSSATAKEQAGLKVVPVKFGSTSSISSAQMQGLKALVQLFARGIGFRFGAWLGAAVKMSLVSVERIVFGDFLGSIVPDENYVAAWNMEPVNAPCFVCMDISLIDPMIDLLLGGTGSTSLRHQPGDITDIEAAILDSVMHEMCSEFTNAWKAAGIEVRHQQRLLSSSHSQAMPARDNPICLSFELQVNSFQGSLQLLLSGLASDTLLRAIKAEQARRAPSPALKQKLRDKALTFRYGASLQLPIAGVSAQAIHCLQPGSILPLNVSTQVPAVFMVAGTPMFYSQPIAAGPHRGAYLTQATLAPKSAAHQPEPRA